MAQWDGRRGGPEGSAEPLERREKDGAAGLSGRGRGHASSMARRTTRNWPRQRAGTHRWRGAVGRRCAHRGRWRTAAARAMQSPQPPGFDGDADGEEDVGRCERRPANAQGPQSPGVVVDASRDDDDDDDAGEAAGERNPATLREVIAGVEGEGPVRMEPSRRRYQPHGGRQLSWWCHGRCLGVGLSLGADGR